MRRRAVPALIGFVLGVSAATVVAQRGRPAQQQQPTFRAGVELVQVDVVVLDEHGQRVTDLTAGDFTIFDRRRAQPVATFAEVAHVWEADGPVPPIDAGSDVADNSSARADRVVVLVVDDLNLSTGRTELVRGLAHRVVSEVGPDASMAVVFTSGRHNVEVTQDRGALHAAIDRAVGVNYVYTLGTETPDTLRQVATALGSVADRRRKAVIVISEWTAPDSRGVFDVPGAMTAPAGSSIGFSGLGGAPDSGQDSPDPPPLELVRMMNGFRRANVALYGIDPRGRLQTTHERMVESRGESPLLRRDDPLVISQETFTETMEATGGFAIVDTNDVDAGLDRVLADLGHYYLLGFYPEEPTDERWHDLQVMVSRPGLAVRHRRGYQLGAEPAKEPDDPMVALSTGVLPNPDLPLRVFAAPVARVRNDARVAVATEVRLPAETLRRPGGRLDDTVELAILAVDLGRSRVTRSAHQTVDVTVPISRVNADGDVTYQVVLGLDLPAASYQLRVSARSARADRAGSAYLTLVVPNVSSQRLAIVGPTIGFGIGTRPAAGVSLVEDGLLPPGLNPVLDRIFTPDDVLRVHHQVWRRDARREASARLEVVDEAGTVVFARDDAVPRANDRNATGNPIDLDIPLAAFAPGGYRLIVTAEGDERQTRREVGFAVRAVR